MHAMHGGGAEALRSSVFFEGKVGYDKNSLASMVNAFFILVLAKL